jgi:hypothetical protein
MPPELKGALQGIAIGCVILALLFWLLATYK